jgi:Flp pilus assembly protein TadG
MRPRWPAQDEHGQAIVLLALALIALLGFAALALDGGNLYTEQRRAQAAADNAVLAAAYAQMDGASSFAQLWDAAQENALTNGYDTSTPQTEVDFYKPPRHGPYAGNNDYLEVTITQTVNTALAHIVYGQNPIPLTVFAVAHGRFSTPVMAGYAIASMKGDCNAGQDAMYIDGRGGGTTGGTYITDGGAFVNSSCPDALDMDGHDPFLTDGMTITVVGGYEPNDPGDICTNYDPRTPAGCVYYPPPSTGAAPIMQDPIQMTPAGTPPDAWCDSQPMRNLDDELADDDIIRPGRYTNLDPGNAFHDTMIMQPGIYCLQDGKLSSGNGGITGEGVMIYLRNLAAEIDFSGSSTVSLRLSAPSLASTGCLTDHNQDICNYVGIVVYKVTGADTCEQNDVEIDFTGQANKDIEGLVYAPYSLIRYGGQGNVYQVGQTIAGCVKFNGNGRIEIVYDPKATYIPPPSLRLDQ